LWHGGDAQVARSLSVPRQGFLVHFKNMSRKALIRWLVVLVALELALVAGYIKTNSASGNTSCTGHGIHNSPRTVISGETEQFTLCLPALPNVTLRYALQYSDGSSEAGDVQTDATGFSVRNVTVRRLPKIARQSVTIIVTYHNTVEQSIRFAVQSQNYQGS